MSVLVRILLALAAGLLMAQVSPGRSEIPSALHHHQTAGLLRASPH